MSQDEAGGQMVSFEQHCADFISELDALLGAGARMLDRLVDRVQELREAESALVNSSLHGMEERMTRPDGLPPPGQ